MRAELPKMKTAEGSEPCGEGTYSSTNTVTTKACGKVYKIKSGPLHCNSEKVLHDIGSL